MRHSAVLIIPAELKTAADAMGAALGWGPLSFTIPLGDGDSVTHFAARADCDSTFIGWCRGTIPPPAQAIPAVLEAVIADFSPDPSATDDNQPVLWGHAHLRQTLLREGLSQMHA